MKEQYWVPEYFLGALLYGTREWSLTPEEEADLILWMHKEKIDGYNTFSELERDEFRWLNDVNNLGGSCVLVETWRPAVPYTETLADLLMDATSTEVVDIVLKRLDVILMEVKRPNADRSSLVTFYEAELPDGSLYVRR